MWPAIAFTNTIKSSQMLEAPWDGIIERAVALLPERESASAFGCETRLVDGQYHALKRKSRIERLKGESEGSCRILSNARCSSCPCFRNASLRDKLAISGRTVALVDGP